MININQNRYTIHIRPLNQVTISVQVVSICGLEEAQAYTSLAGKMIYLSIRTNRQPSLELYTKWCAGNWCKSAALLVYQSTDKWIWNSESEAILVCSDLHSLKESSPHSDYLIRRCNLMVHVWKIPRRILDCVILIKYPIL